MPVLEQWGIPDLRLIHQVQFHHGSRPWCFTLPRPAVAIQRQVVECALAARARALGARIRERSAIQQITPATANSPFRLQCTNGEMLEARQIIVATGKLLTPALPSASGYVGFKTYIPQVLSPDGLDMFSLSRGYLGVIAVTQELSNLTGLVTQEAMRHAGGTQAFLQHFLQTQPLFKLSAMQRQAAVAACLEGAAPGFGRRALPAWPGAWWIGDAIAAIHPAIGYGFAHSVATALIASAGYLQQVRHIGSVPAHRDKLRTILGLSGLMHHLLQRPACFRLLTPLLRRYPIIGRKFLHTLDY